MNPHETFLNRPRGKYFRTSLLLSLCCVAVLLIAASCAGQRVAPLSVMTYNIRLGTADDGPDRWEVRKARVVHLLRKRKPDVIGLQEALHFQIEDLLQAFPDYDIIGVGRADGKTAGEYSAIMYHKKRLQHLQSETFWLSEEPHVPNSMHWGNTLARICTWARFRDRKSDRAFYLYNTHLDHISQPSRVEGTRLILTRIQQREHPDPVLLTGDLNVDETNPVCQMMDAEGFCDTFRVIHPEGKPIGTTNFFLDNPGPAKIDFIYADPSWAVRAAKVVTDKVDGRWPSDHLPVTAVVELLQ